MHYWIRENEGHSVSFTVCSTSVLILANLDFVDQVLENVFEDLGEASEREWKTSELAKEEKRGTQWVQWWLILFAVRAIEAERARDYIGSQDKVEARTGFLLE